MKNYKNKKHKSIEIWIRAFLWDSDKEYKRIIKQRELK